MGYKVLLLQMGEGGAHRLRPVWTRVRGMRMGYKVLPMDMCEGARVPSGPCRCARLVPANLSSQLRRRSADGRPLPLLLPPNFCQLLDLEPN